MNDCAICSSGHINENSQIPAHIQKRDKKKNLSIAVNFEKKFYSYRKAFELIYKYEQSY